MLSAVSFLPANSQQMNTSRPKGQHYIPRMLLNHFCNSHGELWVGDTDTKRVWKTKPSNAFKIKHLYTRNRFAKGAKELGSKDFRYEESLAKLEGIVAPTIKNAIMEFRNCRYPLLSLEEDFKLKEFMFAMARRTPESQLRVIGTQDFEDTFYQVARTIAERERYPLPEKKKLYESIEVLRHVNQVRRNVFARFAAGADERMVEEANKLCAETGLAFVIGAVPNREFVIGSHGIGILESSQGEHHSFLPLAHDLCVWLTPYADRTLVHILKQEEEWLLEKMNQATAARSRQIAGRTESVVRSLF